MKINKLVQTTWRFNAPPHIAVVEARFYETIADTLFQGAEAVLHHAGATLERHTVPGSLEIPAAMNMLLRARAHSNRHKMIDGFVLLGCIIRGETSHYDVVVNECMRGVTLLTMNHALAVGNAVLTVDTLAQATERADLTQGNKGAGAAEACLTLVQLRHSLGLAA